MPVRHLLRALAWASIVLVTATCSNSGEQVTVVVTIPSADHATSTPAISSSVPTSEDAPTTETDLSVPGPGVCLASSEERFLELINGYRAENGLNSLEPVAALNLAAYRHSVDMGTRGYFDHVTPGGLEPWDRARRAGYDDFTRISENIFGATNGDNATAAFESWKASEEHNAAMLDPAVTMIGIGFAKIEDSRLIHYWTTLFGDQPADPPPESCRETES